MNNTNLLLFYLILSVFALASAIMIYPTLKYGPKEDKKVVRKSKKSSKKKK